MMTRRRARETRLHALVIDLPAEMLVLILRFLPGVAIAAVPQTCEAWRAALAGEAATVDEIIRTAVFTRWSKLLESAMRLPARELYRAHLHYERFNKWGSRRRIGQGRAGCFGDNSYYAVHETLGEGVIKRIRGDDQGLPATALREVSLLKELHHPNVIRLTEWYHFPTDNALWLVYERCGLDLKKYMQSKQYTLSVACIKSLTYQLFSGLAWCHSRGIMHRDLLPRSLLVDPHAGVLKLSRFGLARPFLEDDCRTYTHEVVTLWYRAPEILLGAGHYSSAVDMWSVGTIIPEMVTGHPLFPGDSEIDQLFKTFRLLGTPKEAAWPGVTRLPDFNPAFPRWEPKPLRVAVAHLAAPGAEGIDDAGLDLVTRCLTYAPAARLTAHEALGHPFFDDLNKDAIGTAPLPS